MTGRYGCGTRPTARQVRVLAYEFSRVRGMRSLRVDGQTHLAVVSDDDGWQWKETRQCAAGRLDGHTGMIRALCVVDTASGPLLATTSTSPPSPHIRCSITRTRPTGSGDL